MKEILLSNGMKTMVDDEDFDTLNLWPWHAEKRHNNVFYAYSKHMRMHRFILRDSLKPKQCIDHIDGNGLNNQRSNLRICSQRQNLYNSKLRKTSKSGFKGVSEYTAKRLWKDYNGPVYRARITFKNKEIALGFFKCPKEAAKARDLKAKELHGEFALLNFPNPV